MRGCRFLSKTQSVVADPANLFFATGRDRIVQTGNRNRVSAPLQKGCGHVYRNDALRFVRIECIVEITTRVTQLRVQIEHSCVSVDIDLQRRHARVIDQRSDFQLVRPLD